MTLYDEITELRDELQDVVDNLDEGVTANVANVKELIDKLARALNAAPARDERSTSIVDALEHLVSTIYDARDHHPTAEWLALQDAERALKANDDAAPAGDGLWHCDFCNQCVPEDYRVKACNACWDEHTDGISANKVANLMVFYGKMASVHANEEFKASITALIEAAREQGPVACDLCGASPAVTIRRCAECAKLQEPVECEACGSALLESDPRYVVCDDCHRKLQEPMVPVSVVESRVSEASEQNCQDAYRGGYSHEGDEDKLHAFHHGIRTAFRSIRECLVKTYHPTPQTDEHEPMAPVSVVDDAIEEACGFAKAKSAVRDDMTCEHCEGRGYFPMHPDEGDGSGEERCTHCNGKGYHTAEEIAEDEAEDEAEADRIRGSAETPEPERTPAGHRDGGGHIMPITIITIIRCPKCNAIMERVNGWDAGYMACSSNRCGYREKLPADRPVMYTAKGCEDAVSRTAPKGGE